MSNYLNASLAKGAPTAIEIAARRDRLVDEMVAWSERLDELDCAITANDLSWWKQIDPEIVKNRTAFHEYKISKKRQLESWIQANVQMSNMLDWILGEGPGA